MVELNEAAQRDGLSVDETLDKLREIALALPGTQETMTSR